MSDDIEHRARTELQELLDENPQIAPTQFIDGDKLATVSVAEGVPQIAKSELPAATRYDCPHITELHGTPVYRIYSIMQSLQCLSAERQQEGAAQILTQTAVGEVEGVRTEPPQLPPAPEVINSTVSGDVDLRSKPNACGMFRNLEALEQRYQEMLAQHPELEPLILQTPKGPVEIRVTEKRLAFSPTPAKASMYIAMSTICPTDARACFLAISLGFLFRPTVSMPHAMAPLETTITSTDRSLTAFIWRAKS